MIRSRGPIGSQFRFKTIEGSAAMPGLKAQNGHGTLAGCEMTGSHRIANATKTLV